MYCEYCGVQLKEGQAYCPKCGSKIELKEEPKKKTNRGKRIIALICCIVLLVSGTIGGLYFKSKNSAIYNSDGNYIALEAGFTDVKISDEASALKAIESVKDVIGITDTQTELKKDRIDKLSGTSIYRFNQYSDDLLVYGKSIVVIADNKGKALGLTANYNSDFEKKESRISIEDAENSVKKELEKTDSVYHITEDPIYYEYNNKMHLCYVIYDSNGNQYFIDSTNKKVIKRISNYSQAKADCRVGDKKFTGIKLDNGQYLLGDQDRHIFLFNAQNRPVYKENSDFTASMIVDSSTAMTSVDNVFGDEKDPFYSNDYHIGYNLLKNLTIVSDFYRNLNQEQNTACLAIINDSFNFNGVFDGSNAFGGYEYVKNIETKTALPYDDERIISFSLGTQLCNDMENCIDTIGHEYTHGITKSILEWGSLNGNNYPGALSEAYSDIMGELIEAKINKQTPDWKHGDRNIKEPSANSSVHPYPASMNDFNNASTYKDKDGTVYYYNDDKNGVTDFNHFACEIISHCAYLMYNGIDGDNTKKITAEQLANLWYYSLFILQSSPTFEQCRTALELSARIMLNNKETKFTKQQYQCVKEAFDSVGIQAAGYTYSKTVKNDFDLKVINSKGTEGIIYNYELYSIPKIFSGPGIINSTLPKKIKEESGITGAKHFTLEDGTYKLIVTENSPTKVRDPIICKLVIDGNNPNSKKEVEIRTDFDEVITVEIPNDSGKYEDIYYKYINDTIIPTQGYCGEYDESFSNVPENELYSKIKNLKGISSAYIKDINEDGITEMITVSTLGKGSANGTEYYADSIVVDVHCYTIDKKQNVVDCGKVTGIGAFKNADEQAYVYFVDGTEPRICVSFNYWTFLSTASTFGQALRAYTFDGKPQEKESVLFHFSHGDESYSINGENINIDNAGSKSSSVFKSLGLTGLSVESGWNKFPDNCKKICTLGTRYANDGTYEAFIEDYTDLASHIDKSNKKSDSSQVETTTQTTSESSNTGKFYGSATAEQLRKSIVGSWGTLGSIVPEYNFFADGNCSGDMPWTSSGTYSISDDKTLTIKWGGKSDKDEYVWSTESWDDFYSHHKSGTYFWCLKDDDVLLLNGKEKYREGVDYQKFNSSGDLMTNITGSWVFERGKMTEYQINSDGTWVENSVYISGGKVIRRTKLDNGKVEIIDSSTARLWQEVTSLSQLSSYTELKYDSKNDTITIGGSNNIYSRANY